MMITTLINKYIINPTIKGRMSLSFRWDSSSVARLPSFRTTTFQPSVSLGIDFEVMKRIHCGFKINMDVSLLRGKP